MHSWIDSWAFWAGILSGLAGAVSAAAALIASRRPVPAPGFIEGRAAPIVALSSPATGRDCVQYHERVETPRPQALLEGLAEAEAENRRGFYDEEAIAGRAVGSFFAGRAVGTYFVNRTVGAFLVESEAGKAVVWPDEKSMSYAAGWTARETDDGSRVSSERILPVGAKVRVSGTPGTFDAMMAGMARQAADLPNDLLTALQMREDLRALPCYWPRGGGFSVEEEGAVLDEGDEPAGPGVYLMIAAAAFLLSALLMTCAYRRIL
jgi:hypothetical protein